MSFWTDAAILGGAGIPSLLFGPGGAGLHSVEEYVNIADVYTCRDVLVDTVRRAELDRSTKHSTKAHEDTRRHEAVKVGSFVPLRESS